MVSALLRRPSLSVVGCVVILVIAFAWRGDLRVQPGAQDSQVALDARTEPDSKPVQGPGPVVVRRSDDDARAKVRRARRAGRVFDTMGFLLVGAEVNAARSGATRTDADGSFAIELEEELANDVMVRADGRRTRWLRTTATSPDALWIRLEPAAPWDEPASRPEPAVDLRGEGVVLGADAQPLAGAFVNVVGSDCWGRSDDIGRFSVPLPGPTSVLLAQRAGVDGGPSVASLSQPFQAPRERGVVPIPDLVAEPAGTLRGTVRDPRGEPIVGLPVEVRSEHVRRVAESGPGGAFAVAGLLPDEYEVRPFAYRGAVATMQRVRIDREEVACDLHLVRCEEAPLRVVDESGAVASGVWVASQLHGLRRGVAQADAEGLVSLPVAAASDFEVRAGADYAALEVRRFEPDATPATIVIAQP